MFLFIFCIHSVATGTWGLSSFLTDLARWPTLYMSSGCGIVHHHHCHCLCRDLQVTWLMPMSLFVAYVLAYFPIDAHFVMWHIYGIWGHIWCWHIFCSSVENILVYKILMDVCSNMGSVCRLQKCSGTFMCSVVGIFVQGHMPVMWNVYIPGVLVMLLIAMSWYKVYAE